MGEVAEKLAVTHSRNAPCFQNTGPCRIQAASINPVNMKNFVELC